MFGRFTNIVTLRSKMYNGDKMIDMHGSRSAGEDFSILLYKKSARLDMAKHMNEFYHYKPDAVSCHVPCDKYNIGVHIMHVVEFVLLCIYNICYR